MQGVARHGSDAHAILRRRLAHRAVASHCVLLAARLPSECCRAKAPPAAPQRLDRRAARHEQRQPEAAAQCGVELGEALAQKAEPRDADTPRCHKPATGKGDGRGWGRFCRGVRGAGSAVAPRIKHEDTKQRHARRDGRVARREQRRVVVHAQRLAEPV